MLRRFFLFLCPPLLPLTLFAWGATGHRVVGAIAADHLTKKASKAVQDILGDESMAIAATWMDEVRSDPADRYMRDWHWVTIPDGETYATAEKNPKGDAVGTIGRMEQLLKSDTVPPDRRRMYLRILIHLVGDIHQPLHVGKGDDKGGNDLQVRWFKKGSDLHRIWDSGMIDEYGLSYTELAASLDHATPAQITAWQKGDAASWAQECLAFRPAVYAVQKGEALGYDYQYRNLPIVKAQLLKAGIRLAGVLNALFS
jgi:hypothetical protein